MILKNLIRNSRDYILSLNEDAILGALPKISKACCFECGNLFANSFGKVFSQYISIMILYMILIYRFIK